MLSPPLFSPPGKGLLFCWKNTQPPWVEHQYSISSSWRDLPSGKAEKLPSLAQIQTELHQNSPLCKNSRLRAPPANRRAGSPSCPSARSKRQKARLPARFARVTFLPAPSGGREAGWSRASAKPLPFLVEERICEAGQIAAYSLGGCQGETRWRRRRRRKIRS